MARPEAKIDWDIVDRLAKAGCLGTEIAAFFGIHPDTFYKRVQDKYSIGFSEFLHEKKHRGEALLRMQQYEKAIGESKKGDNMMLIWLGKNRLGQKDHEDKIVVTTEAMEKLEKSMSLVSYLQSKAELDAPSAVSPLNIEDNSNNAEQKS